MVRLSSEMSSALLACNIFMLNTVTTAKKLVAMAKIIFFFILKFYILNSMAAKNSSYLNSKTILLYHCLAGTILMADTIDHQILLNPYLCHITSFLFWFGGSRKRKHGQRRTGASSSFSQWVARRARWRHGVSLRLYCFFLCVSLCFLR